MKMSLRIRNYPIAKLQNRSRGYMLITLMLFLALLAIAALAVLPDVAFQIKRDREEELIHRAVAYSRGIRRYYKKFGRYPNRLEDLETTNNLRFIRKRYKDPITDQDFTILRWGDPRLVGLMPGSQIPGPGLKGPPRPGTTSVGTPPAGGTGLNATTSGTQVTQGTNTDAGNPPATRDTSSSTQQVFGGGPILGVVSASTAETIREFNNKNHYNDWLFVYDPASDRGGLLNGPLQPNLNRGLGGIGGNPIGGQVPPNPGTPGGVPPAQNPPNPGSQAPPMQ
jgi:type II secretory pathway pseudopilin PulG